LTHIDGTLDMKPNALSYFLISYVRIVSYPEITILFIYKKIA